MGWYLSTIAVFVLYTEIQLSALLE